MLHSLNRNQICRMPIPHTTCKLAVHGDVDITSVTIAVFTLLRAVLGHVTLHLTVIAFPGVRT